MGTFRRLVCVAVCFLSSGCASSQLNYNAADLASSLNALQKRQIFFNLAQALNDPEFVPSQVTISIGTAQTANAVTPTISLPLGALLADSTARVKLESEVEALSRKLADRKLLDRAKGLLQASFQWTEEEAYLHLRRTSRQRRTPMRDIAREVIDLAGGIQ